MGAFAKILGFKKNETPKVDHENMWHAMNKSAAVIEFTVTGEVINANKNFLDCLGYSLEEIQGKHHRIFCETGYANSDEYKEFWLNLKAGKFSSNEYKRIRKDGKPIWIQATYNPVHDIKGNVKSVVKFATDITAQKELNSEFKSMLAGINRVQAVIEFDAAGNVLYANDNFLAALGYPLKEIVGRHHSMFCDSQVVNSVEYARFWNDLREGQQRSGQFKRKNSKNDDIWIEASYTPIVNAEGKVYKVIKFATDVTKLVELKNMIIELDKAGKQLAKSSEQLESAATQMNDNSQQTTVESQACTVTSKNVLAGVTTLAASTEEMVASIKEISRSTSESSRMAMDTMAVATTINERVSELGNSSNEIGQVIIGIGSIAQQTNILALNATIEAARAGEFGKGFVVVASEVKELARQTSHAAENIKAKVLKIQSETTNTIDSVQLIHKAINNLNNILSSIAAAVEEQTATTNEVSRIVNMSAHDVESISGKVENVTQIAMLGSKLSSSTLSHAQSINPIASQIRMIAEKARF